MIFSDSFDPSNYQDAPDAADAFEAGDVVVLRGQDFPMTVAAYCADCGLVAVAWHDANGSLQFVDVDEDMLVNLDDLED